MSECPVKSVSDSLKRVSEFILTTLTVFSSVIRAMVFIADVLVTVLCSDTDSPFVNVFVIAWTSFASVIVNGFSRKIRTNYYPDC
jgi:hypothetical protein